MSISPHEIPEAMRRCMPASERKAMGIQTVQEAQEAYDDRAEKDLLRLCKQQLSRCGVRVVHHLSHRAREHAGYPDLTFVLRGVPMACELKTKRGVVSAEQEATLAAMRRDGWRTMVCRTFDHFRQWVSCEGGDEANDRAGNLSVELADMTRNRDELRQEVQELKRVFGCTERERKNALERAWNAENSLTIRRSLCRDIAVELGCEGLEGDESLETGLAAIRAMKQARDAAR